VKVDQTYSNLVYVITLGHVKKLMRQNNMDGIGKITIRIRRSVLD
jgi:hypothetical protein